MVLGPLDIGGTVPFVHEAFRSTVLPGPSNNRANLGPGARAGDILTRQSE